MKNINTDDLFLFLNKIFDSELSGVIRYTNFALIITGPYRLSLVEFFKSQAAESLLHAHQVGDILTGLGGKLKPDVVFGELADKMTLEQILKLSLKHEEENLVLYNDLLGLVEGKSVFLEEYARKMIGTEEEHTLELRKLLRDFA